MIKERFNQSSKNLDRMDSQFNQSDSYLDRMKSHIDQQRWKVRRIYGYDDEFMDMTRETRQCLAGLEQEAWQPRLATESDVKPDTKNRKRAEDAAADRVRSGDSFSAQPSRSRPDVPGQFR